ncbi:MAG: M20/M25/M40 family metallo-hydrolase [Armatimonadetes bacterium]|nr:M20/M25/M40 family metallo-hydrolase [Armatimonadota bacterium]
MPDRQRMVEEFVELARIASLSKKEKAMAEAVAAKLRELGLEPEFDSAGEAIGGEVGNLIAHLPATQEGLPRLMFNAHLDTVAPGEGIEPVVEGDRISSAGDTIVAADDKCGVVAALETVRCLMEENLAHGGVDVVFTIAEEIGLYGAKHLDYSRVGAELAYVLDGGEQPGCITRAAPYANSINFTVRGRAAHAGVCPEQGINALQAAAKGIACMNLGRLDERSTANVGVIEGGKAPNIVPDLCVVQGEARSHDEARLEAQTEHMVECMERAAEEFGAKVEPQIQRSYNGFFLDDNDPVVALAAKAAQALGLEPQLEIGGGGSDANIFNEHGLPAVIISTGAASVHTTQEYVHIPTMVQAADWLLQIVRLLAEEV